MRSLRYRIETVEKDLGTLSQTLLKNFLKEVFKNFKNFNQGDFYPYVYAVLFFCSRLRATHSGCSETNSVNGIGTTVVSLRYRIEMVQVSYWLGRNDTQVVPYKLFVLA